jgi:hypothetical protein
MLQRVEHEYQAPNNFQIMPMVMPTMVADTAPVEARMPISRSAFEVAAYRCPVLAATIFNLATETNQTLAAFNDNQYKGLVREILARHSSLAPVL